jgi:hypothetical protein
LEIRFSTLPPDCTVVNVSDPDAPFGVGAIRVQRAHDLRFRLLKPGYNSLEVTIPAQAVPAGPVMTWPLQQGSFLRLEPVLVTATFATAPQGAEIWTSRQGRSDDYLGLTGAPVLLNLADLLSSSKEGSFRIRLVAPGYQTVEVPIPEHLFGTGRANRWPAEGEYALAPTEGLLAPVVFAFRLRPWYGSLVVLVSLIVLALLVRSGLSVRDSLARARAIEGRLAEPGCELSGSRLGPYRLYEVLGRGATATVFRGVVEEDRPGRSAVAIKVFHLGEDAARRLSTEVKPLMELRHPNLVALLDWGQVDGFAYLVTELVPGRTLRQQLEHGPLGLEAWRMLVDDLLRGLEHSHQRSVVHGDIKPENVLMPFHGKAKLVDFGLSRSVLRPGLERFGGTPGYMAPELMAGHPPTVASDIYAAGTVLYEALYGSFPGGTEKTEDPYPELGRVLAGMRHPDPKNRPEDAEEARQALLAARVKR